MWLRTFLFVLFCCNSRCVVPCVVVSVWLLWFRCAVVSVNSDLSCMFINKISTVVLKKKKLWSIWVKVFVLIMVFSVCCWIRVGKIGRASCRERV